ncbi:MAG: tetratricopeptide repeat protein [Brevinematales bacterium]|nr:tetratricopeptide repeat protein [Brevinematales bacterium]
MRLTPYLRWIGIFLLGGGIGFLLGVSQNPVTRAIRVAEKLAASQKIEDKKASLERLTKQKDLITLATLNARVENARRLVALSLADRLIAQKMWNEAARYMEIARDITPGSTGIAYREGLIYYNLAYTAVTPSERDAYAKKAEERLRFVLKQEPENPDALYLLTLMALESRDAKQAYEYIARAYKVNPKNVDILFALARVYYELGEYEQAKKVYGRLQTLLPKNDSRLETVERNLDILNQKP